MKTLQRKHGEEASAQRDWGKKEKPAKRDARVRETGKKRVY